MKRYLVLGPEMPLDLDSPPGRLLGGVLAHPHLWITHSLAVLSCFAANPAGRALLAFQTVGQKYTRIGGPSAIWIRTGVQTTQQLFVPSQSHRIHATGICLFAHVGPESQYERIGPVQVASWPQAISDLFFLQLPKIVIWRCLFAAARDGQDVPDLLRQASVLDYRRQSQHRQWQRRWLRLMVQPRLGAAPPASEEKTVRNGTKAMRVPER